MSAPHPILPCGPAAEGYGPALATVLPENFPPMAAGSLVFIDGVLQPEPNSFKKRRTSPKIYTDADGKPTYNYGTPTAGKYKYKQPAFFVDHTLARQNSVSLQTTGILTVKVHKAFSLQADVTKTQENTPISFVSMRDNLPNLVRFTGYLKSECTSNSKMTFEVKQPSNTEPYEFQYKRTDNEVDTYTNEKLLITFKLEITPGQVLSYDDTIQVGNSNYSILKPMIDEREHPAAIVLSAEDIDDEPDYCVCRVFVSNLFDLVAFARGTPEDTKTETASTSGKRPNFLNFFIGKLTGGTREKHDYDR